MGREHKMIRWKIGDNKTLKDCVEEEKEILKKDYLIDIDQCIKQYDLNKGQGINLEALWNAMIDECYNYFPTVLSDEVSTGKEKISFSIKEGALSICLQEHCFMSAFLTSIICSTESDRILGLESYGSAVKDGKIALYSIFPKDEKGSRILNLTTVDDHKDDFCKSEFGYNLWKNIGGNEPNDDLFSQTGGFDLMYDAIYPFSIAKWKTNPYNDILSTESEKFYASSDYQLAGLNNFFYKDNKSVDSKYSYYRLCENYNVYDEYVKARNSTEEKRFIDKWLYNLIYHYDYILRTHAYLDENIKFTIIKQSPLVIVDEHESKKRILLFLLGRLSMIPAPFTRIYVARDLIDSYIENAEQLSEEFISGVLNDYIMQFKYVTMCLVERVFHVLLYEVITRQENHVSVADFFTKQRELTLHRLKEIMEMVDKQYHFLEAKKYPESYKSMANKEIGVFLHSCCYFYHQYNAYQGPELIDLSESEKQDIDRLLAKYLRADVSLSDFNSDNFYFKRFIQVLIKEKVYDMTSFKRKNDKIEIIVNRSELLEKYFDKSNIKNNSEKV
jgi:hypothetical protein